MNSVKAVEVQRWENWSGSVVSKPAKVMYPKSIEEIILIVKQCNKTNQAIRVVGSGHSFTSLVATNDLLLSLDLLEGVEQTDRENDIVSVWAGTKLHVLGEALHKLGYAQENLGDINAQSIAGAISTGTHGTGIQFSSLATQVVEMTVVTGKGELLECSMDKNTQMFKALQLSLGALGIIVKLKLKVLPAYKLLLESKRMYLDDCLQNLDKYKTENRHFEFFWFPYSKYVQAKFVNKTNDDTTKKNITDSFNKKFIENGLYRVLSEGCRLIPSLSKSVSRLSGRVVPNERAIDDSYKVFASIRDVKFNEMEYNIPANQLANVLTEIKDMINEKKFPVHFPIECRYVKRDDIWLSPAFERDSAYIAVHMYKGMEYKDYFRSVEQICRKYNGRPHWGKMHTLTAHTLKEVYPFWNEFLQLRNDLDPNSLFLNTYLRQIFDIAPTSTTSTNSQLAGF
ncbi:D-arabinono-1,4-lactone oxidase [Cytobacillus sp. Hm23]